MSLLEESVRAETGRLCLPFARSLPANYWYVPKVLEIFLHITSNFPCIKTYIVTCHKWIVSYATYIRFCIRSVASL